MTWSRRAGRLDPDTALKGFFKDPDWMFKTGVGGTINALCAVVLLMQPLLMPVALALMAVNSGYLLRTIRYKLLNPESKLPDWNDWLELFMSGLTWLAIQFGLTTILVGVVSVSLIVSAALATSKLLDPNLLTCAIIIAFMIVTAAQLLVSFATPYLMVNFAAEEKVLAGLALIKVGRKTVSNAGNFLLAWLLGIGVMWASVVLPALTVIGVFIIPSTIFIGHVVCASLASQAWGSD